MLAATTPADFDTHVHARMYKDGTPMPLALIMLGLAGETGEALEIVHAILASKRGEWPRLQRELILELGDVLWYATGALLATGTSLDKMGHMDTGNVPMRALEVEVGAVCEMVKKHEWHGKTLDIAKFHLGLYRVIMCLEDYATQAAVDLTVVAAANIEKLNKRYPLELGGFKEGGGIRGTN
jgi:hypothetical protein